MNKILIWLHLRKKPPVPVHMIPWPQSFRFAVAANIAKAHNGTGFKPWKSDHRKDPYSGWRKEDDFS